MLPKSSSPPPSDVTLTLGAHTHPLGPAEVVAIDASTEGIRVHTPDSPGLMGFLTAVTPAELAPFVQAVVHRGKRALAPAGAPLPRDGWLLDASGSGLHLWNHTSKRAVQLEPGFFFAAVELYARVALEPWEGRLDGPAWVDELRVAHIELLTVLRRFSVEAMQPVDTPADPPARASVDPSDRDLPQRAEAALFGQQGADGGQLARFELDLRRVTAPWSGAAIAEDGGAPGWIGDARYLLGITAGRLLGDRVPVS